jgi:ATP-binding cassette, subfamily F, member 3
MANEVILRFSSVSFDYGHNKTALDEASFSVREGSKLTLMGQNGAGKSTLFSLITKEQKPKEGEIYFTPKDLSVAIAHQVMKKEYLPMTVREYFATAFTEKKYNLDKLIKDVFEVVNLPISSKKGSDEKAYEVDILEKKVGMFSGGQQARLLLAYALIQNPDILLLDEPTNNLDQTGIEHLTGFLMMYEKTCLVISHDAEFLNAFSDGVLYLDVFTHKIEQYTGNYFDVVEEIKQRIERENLQNARMESQIKEKRAQAEVFAHKGGKLRAVAKRMRESAEDAEENIVDVRREDKTIREFEIPCQDYGSFFNGQVLEITSINAIKDHELVPKKLEMILRKNTHLIISGPNGIGKSTFLQSLNEGTAEGVKIAENIVLGYYKQDFSNLDFEQRAFDCLRDAMQKFDEQEMRSIAAGFLLDGKLLDSAIGSLSEGQKGLLAFCRLVLLRPGLLILDEPTNHINFRHLPIIAKALHEYQGAMIVVSHVPDFVKQIRIDKEIDLGKI